MSQLTYGNVAATKAREAGTKLRRKGKAPGVSPRPIEMPMHRSDARDVTNLCQRPHSMLRPAAFGESAVDTRASTPQSCVDGPSAPLRRLGRPFRFGRTTIAEAGVFSCVLLLALGVTMECATAQDAKETKEARLEAPATPSDDARLAAVGITAATIDEEADIEALWRAVRELVLPGLVSEAMQQRILRRVWMVDPAIRHAPVEPFTAD